MSRFGRVRGVSPRYSGLIRQSARDTIRKAVDDRDTLAADEDLPQARIDHLADELVDGIKRLLEVEDGIAWTD